ncbi:MAG: hypothetical protein ABJG78_10095 [Cyclobacteriaceae bacterium]
MKLSRRDNASLPAILRPICLMLVLLPSICGAQSMEYSTKQSKATFRFDQYVMVTMKNGHEMPAKIMGTKSKNQYVVRMIGGKKAGLVKRRFIREMTAEEIAEFRKSKTIVKSH